jgi:hypothetical protein
MKPYAIAVVLGTLTGWFWPRHLPKPVPLRRALARTLDAHGNLTLHATCGLPISSHDGVNCPPQTCSYCTAQPRQLCPVHPPTRFRARVRAVPSRNRSRLTECPDCLGTFAGCHCEGGYR